MKNRIDELKHRKTRKIQLYDKITYTFGKTSEVQKCMFAIFRDNLDEKFNFNSIETIVKNRLARSKEDPKRALVRIMCLGKLCNLLIGIKNSIVSR